MDLFFLTCPAYCSLSLPPLSLSLYVLILILLIKLREPAGLLPPPSHPHLQNFLTGSIKGWRKVERGRDREGEERGVRETKQRVDSWQICSASYQYLDSVNETLQRSSLPLDTQYTSKAIWESSLHAHTYMHADITYSILHMHKHCTYGAN